MARKKQNEILVGLVSLTGITLLLVLIFLMGSFDALTERRTTVEARFRDVQGLSVGDPVYLFGMKAGTVDAIELLEKERQNERAELAVMMNIPASYRDYLRENTPVHIDKSLTGSISVLIHETEDGSGAELPEGAWLAGRGGRRAR